MTKVLEQKDSNEERFKRLLTKIQENDPWMTEVTLQPGWSSQADAAKALAKALETNTHITTLNANFIGTPGVKELAKVLRGSSIKNLNVSSGCIGDEGAEALAKVLPDSNIVTLDLSLNGIGDRGAAALAKVLLNSDTITNLNVHSNIIYRAGGAALVAASVQNPHLTTLNVSCNINAHAAGAEGDEFDRVIQSNIRRNIKLKTVVDVLVLGAEDIRDLMYTHQSAADDMQFLMEHKALAVKIMYAEYRKNPNDEKFAAFTTKGTSQERVIEEMSHSIEDLAKTRRARAADAPVVRSNISNDMKTIAAQLGSRARQNSSFVPSTVRAAVVRNGPNRDR